MKDTLSLSADRQSYAIALPHLQLADCRISVEADGQSAGF